MMNGCQKCDDGYGFLARTDDGAKKIEDAKTDKQYIDRTYCVKLPDNNRDCYAFFPMDNNDELKFDAADINTLFPSRGRCVACKPGFFLNSQHFCEKIEVLNAEKDMFMEHLTNKFFV